MCKPSLFTEKKNVHLKRNEQLILRFKPISEGETRTLRKDNFLLFLKKSDEKGACTAIVQALGKSCKPVLCTLRFKGTAKFINVIATARASNMQLPL